MMDPQLQQLFFKLALGYARVAPVFYLLPFLSANLLGSQIIKNTLIVLVTLGFSALLPEVAPDVQARDLLAQCLSEGLIGLCIGLMLVLPFWVAHAVGAIIDNQRGATLSNTMDPINGVETSELSNLFNLLVAVIFLQAGGMRLVLESLQASYQLFPSGSHWTLNVTAVLGLMDALVGRALLLAAPVMACLFLTEVALGLLSRFAQQLNAFSVAMTVKSTVAFMVLLVYCIPALRDLATLERDATAMLGLMSAH
jgi:type III secretion protein SpaR/YscT/HrcT